MTFIKIRVSVIRVRQITYNYTKGVITILKITIEAARVNAHLTQDEASKRLGVTRQTLYNWENGIVCPSLKNVVKLSELYDIPVDNLDFLPRM